MKNNILENFIAAKKKYNESLSPIYREARKCLRIVNRLKKVDGFEHLGIEGVEINENGHGEIYFSGEEY